MGPGFTDLDEFLAEEFGDVRAVESGGLWSDFNGYHYVEPERKRNESPQSRKARYQKQKAEKAAQLSALPPKVKQKRSPYQDKNEYNRQLMRKKRADPAYREREKKQQKEFREKTPGMRAKNAEYARAYRARKKKPQ